MPHPCDRAFSLVELLVVVAIIAVLLALLTPAMDRAMELAQRAVCAAQLHATGAAMTTWATEHKWTVPEGQPSHGQAASFGIYPVWASLAGGGPNWLEDSVYGRYRGHGALAAQRYVDPRAFYCPSNTLDYLRYDRYTETASAVEMFATGRAGGWPAAGPENSLYDLVWTGYHFRSGFDGPRPKWRGPKPRRDAGHEPVLADAFADGGSGRNVDTHHVEGYSVLTLGVSVRFVADPERLVANKNQGGMGYHSGDANYFQHQKWVWEEFFLKR